MPHRLGKLGTNNFGALQGVAATDLIPIGDEAAEIPGRLEREHTTAEIEADVARWSSSI
jgi:hypothetical protein